MTKRLALLALLAGVLAAVPGPNDHAQAAFPGTNGRIAFVRYSLASPLEEVFMVSPASGLTANMTNDPLTSDTAPSWSPDGTRIAFARGGDQDDGLPLHIYTVALADGSTSQVTGGKVQDLMPSWQPL
jgi:Tol biopolymer transport system component